MSEADNTVKQPSPDDVLADALEFTAEDLAANRKGQLSEMQHWRLRVRFRRSVLTGLGLMFIGVFIATLLIFIGTGEDGSVILTIIGVGIILIDIAIQAVFFRYWQRLIADINSREVQVIEGDLERVIKPVSRRVFNYAVRVNDAEIHVTEQAFNVFDHHQSYILYRTPNTGILLSASCLDQGN